MSKVFIGVDVGTGSARAGVFDARGRLIASARRPIALWREPGDVVEQSCADIWRATTEAVRDAVEASGIPPGAFAGVGFAATCSLVALDAGLTPLSVNRVDAPGRDVMAWMDHRAAEDAERINAAGHESLRYVGRALSPEMQTPKLAWLSRMKPETFAKAAHFLGLTDYLSFRATGSLARSLCSVVCKFGYQAHERRWPSEFLQSVGLAALAENDFARLGAEILEPGMPVGSGLTSEAAADMGLIEGTPVGAGLVDAHAGALASLAASDEDRPGDPRLRLALILGTSSSCLAVSDEPRFIDAVWGPHLSGLIPGQWLMDGGQSAFGAAIDRLVRMHPLSGAVAAQDYDALERGIATRAGGLSRAALLADGLHVLPSFIGERAPVADAAARGGVVGLDLREDMASLEELYVAGLCGLAYGIAEIVAAYGRARLRLRDDRCKRRRVAEPSGSPDRRRRLRHAGRLAADARAGVARLGDDRRGRFGRHDRNFRDGVDVVARRARSAGPRRHCRLPRPQTPSRRALRPSRTRGAAGDARGALARGGHFRLRRRPGRQRAHRARRDPPHARRGRARAQRRGDARALPRLAPGPCPRAHRTGNRPRRCRRTSPPRWRAKFL